MNYISLDNYKRKWIFTHQSMPVAEEDLKEIKPMSGFRASQLWFDFVSKKSPSLMHLSKEEWPLMPSTWVQEMQWQQSWDDETDLAADFWNFFDLDDASIVYFCYGKDNIIETRWMTFKKYWKNFLFYDDDPLLLIKKKKNVAQFSQTGFVKLGARP